MRQGQHLHLSIVAISEIAKHSTGVAAMLVSLTLTSVLALIWLHVDGAEPAKIAELSAKTFWLVILSPLLPCAAPHAAPGRR